MFEGAALAFRFDPFNGEDCRAYPAYLAVPADLSVVADLILAGDQIVVVDQSAVVDPTAPADRTVVRVRIVEAVRSVPAVHIWVRIAAEELRNVPVVHISAQIAAEALRSLAVAPRAAVDHYVVPGLNVTVRNGARYAANEVQIALAAQLGPDATVWPKVRRTVQI